MANIQSIKFFSNNLKKKKKNNVLFLFHKIGDLEHQSQNVKYSFIFLNITYIDQHFFCPIKYYSLQNKYIITIKQ